MSSPDPKEQQQSGDNLKTGTNVQTKGESHAPVSGERADKSSSDAPASGQGQSSSGEEGKER
jgi:hypothetical protein